VPSVATPPDIHTDYGSQKQQGGKINADHAAIEAWCGALLTALARVIRPDDTLTDGLVRLRNLHAEVWNQFKVLRVSAHTRATTVWPDGKLVYDKSNGALWVGDGSTQGGLPVSGSGSGGGAVIWHTITADTTAIAGHGYKIDASANPVTLTMPADPAEDDRVSVLAIDTTYAAAVDGGGSNLLGDTEPLTIENDGDGIDLMFTGAVLGWSPSGELSAAHLPVPLTASDLPFAPTADIEAEETHAAVVEVRADAMAAVADAADQAFEDSIVNALIFGG
jgi:hypothetical protein